jgi:hypothetical protein
MDDAHEMLRNVILPHQRGRKVDIDELLVVLLDSFRRHQGERSGPDRCISLVFGLK